MARQSIADKLERARVLLQGAEADAGLAARLATLGYDAAALDAAHTLYVAAGGKVIEAYGARADLRQATQTVEARRAQLDKYYSELAGTCRVIFKDDEPALIRLGLRQPEAPDPQPPDPGTPPQQTRPSESQAAVLARARTLYTVARDHAETQAALLAVGYTAQRLADEFKVVVFLEEADITQEGEKADKKAATRARQAAQAALDTWVARFVGLCCVALKDRPDYLDRLNINCRGKIKS